MEPGDTDKLKTCRHGRMVASNRSRTDNSEQVMQRPQAILIAVIAGNPPARFHAQLAGEWAALAEESLERAYGDDEPEYSEADLVP